MPDKVKTLNQIKNVAARLKISGKKIVFTNGCFDILHRGHVEYLSKAKKLGDVLVVGLNSDSSVRKIKGLNSWGHPAGTSWKKECSPRRVSPGIQRPINKEKDRVIVLAALEAVDYVVVFKELTPYNLIKNIKPDVLVKGGDWKIKNIVGADILKAAGGKVKSIPFVGGYSTTGLLCKINCNA